MNKVTAHKSKLVLGLVLIGVFGCSFSGSEKLSETQTGSIQSNQDEPVLSSTDSNQENYDGAGVFTPPTDRTRRSLASFVVPGISLSRWANTKDVAAWRDTNQPLVSIQSNDDVVYDIGVSKNGGFMASVGAKISVWDLGTLTLIRSWELDSIGREIKLTPDGKTIITVHEDNSIRIWQQETGFNLLTLEHQRSISAMALTKDGSRIASADVGGNISIWDTQTGKRLYSIDDVLRVNTLNFSPDGLWLASSGISPDDVNHTVQIWETRYYALELSLPGHRSVVNSVDFSPDGKFIVTTGRDNTVKIWDLTQGVLFKSLRGHTDDVVKTVFSGDGFWLISSSLDSKLRIWSFPDGRTIKTLSIPYLRPQTLEYVEGRNWVLIIADGNQSIQVWSSSGFTYKPWGDIRNQVGRIYKDLRRILTVPFIPKPQLPSLSSLRKDTFESQINFIDRMAQIYGQKINNQIIRYRRKVDERNRKVAILRQEQGDSRTLVNKKIRDISVRTTRRVLGEVILFPLRVDGRPAYDPDRQLMTMRASFTRAFHRENLVMKMPEGRPAQVFYDDLVAGKVVGNAVFNFISDSRVRLHKVSIRWRGRDFEAFPRKRGSGYRVIDSTLRDISISSKKLQFQQYGIPYTNFNDFIRTILREQLSDDLEAKRQDLTVDREVRKIIPVD